MSAVSTNPARLRTAELGRCRIGKTSMTRTAFGPDWMARGPTSMTTDILLVNEHHRLAVLTNTGPTRDWTSASRTTQSRFRHPWSTLPRHGFTEGPSWVDSSTSTTTPPSH
jgi:hypothetical protein